MRRLFVFFSTLVLPGVLVAMTPAQQAAFRSANTGNARFTELESSFLIAGVATVLALLWFVWVVLSAYKAWGANRLSGEEAGSQVLRSLLVMVVTLVIVAY